VDLGASLILSGKSLFENLGLRTLDCPNHSELPYQVCYPGIVKDMSADLLKCHHSVFIALEMSHCITHCCTRKQHEDTFCTVLTGNMLLLLRLVIIS
jgi:hypothetical protein